MFCFFHFTLFTALYVGALGGMCSSKKEKVHDPLPRYMQPTYSFSQKSNAANSYQSTPEHAYKTPNHDKENLAKLRRTVARNKTIPMRGAKRGGPLAASSSAGSYANSPLITHQSQQKNKYLQQRASDVSPADRLNVPLQQRRQHEMNRSKSTRGMLQLEPTSPRYQQLLTPQQTPQHRAMIKKRFETPPPQLPSPEVVFKQRNNQLRIEGGQQHQQQQPQSKRTFTRVNSMGRTQSYANEMKLKHRQRALPSPSPLSVVDAQIGDRMKQQQQNHQQNRQIAQLQIDSPRGMFEDKRILDEKTTEEKEELMDSLWEEFNDEKLISQMDNRPKAGNRKKSGSW
ncbi:hypothetical protein niasHS_013811 [Heterodera schachtii]|uniref:Uncharacterized protein n=1 Tax=Heterodera schachtii TaxID=97005 RepID=A0ABD2IJ43_HETSC